MKKQPLVMVVAKNIEESELAISDNIGGKRLTRMETKIFRRKSMNSSSIILENNYFNHDTKFSE
jgi:hypothetical protein